jgi:methyltransferase (TIGR00027 family)
MTRTDDDSWDLASSVGATATMVAAGRAMATKDPQALINDPFAEPLVRAVGLDFFVRMIDGDVDASLFPNSSPERMQAIIDGMGLRTKYFDDYLLNAVRSGVRQVVILASGLDARAYRLPWPAGTTVYEIDQPQVIEFKTRTLADLGAEPTATRRTVSIDLRYDWPAALREAGLDTGAPTAWLAEGLLIYLPPEAQDRLFDNITALSVPGSRLATEHVPDPNAFSDERMQRISERWRRFGFDLNAADLFYRGERSVVVDYLTTHGWQVTAHPAKELYARNGFEFPHDEMAATFGDMSYVAATLK